MSEAVTVPSLMLMTLIVSEESLARDRHIQTHTDRQTDRQTDTETDIHTQVHTHRLKVVYLKLFPSRKTLKTHYLSSMLKALRVKPRCQAEGPRFNPSQLHNTL